MPLFIRLAHLTEKANQNLQNMDQMLAEANQIIEANGAKILHAYVILGEYDVVTIMEAPDQKTAAKIGALIATKGSFRAETLPAIPVEEFINSIKGNQ
ncbi:MAG TPA: GYD domain-containing protein [Anaerolineales bacterium]|nr:GYD domain-containing protein [Anaerolineales bacterium]